MNRLPVEAPEAKERAGSRQEAADDDRWPAGKTWGAAADELLPKRGGQWPVTNQGSHSGRVAFVLSGPRLFS